MRQANATSSDTSALPIAIVGAGPIGLAAAVHLLARGERPVLLEAGQAVAASIREWGHVRLFSPWKYLVDAQARRRLEAHGWAMPDAEELPTGRQLVERYLEPLAALPDVAATLRHGRRVVAVSRRGIDKVKSAGRDEAPFELVLADSEGREERLLARAVIDASGTWAAPNPLGASGLPIPGERALSDRITHRIPDVLGAERSRYAGKRVLVVGSGHSAFNALLDLAQLADEVPATEVVWAIRRPEVGLMFGGGRRDALAARGSLGSRLQELVESRALTLVRGFRAAAVVEHEGQVLVEGDDGTVLGPFDELVVTTGFRPDLTLTRELRLELDPWLESPVRLAPLIDPNVHSCGTVYPHGAAELAHPETGYYVVGMKSYGRAPTFLLLTGYEQVRSIAAALAGDLQAAREVCLKLPETGVCSISALPVVGALAAAAQKTASCCAPTCCSKD
jgi:NADPH-dependent 2,4-dienoyl-CoA reductase/sulfur reductase-like enzyme